MPFQRPTLLEIIQRVENDIQSKIGGTGAPLRRSIVKILARAFSGVIHSLYNFLNWISLQLFVTTAESEQLDRHGFIWGLDRKAATFSTGYVEFSGDFGELIPIGTILQNDQGLEYATIEQGVLDVNGVASIQIQASLAGSDYNLDSGVVLTLQTAIPFVNTTALVLEDGILGGAFVEGDEEYRARILFRIQNPPQGGAKNDYIIWATSSETVTDAWCFPLFFGAGTVLVTVANRNNNPPIVPDLTDVQNIIEINRPVTANVTIASVVPSEVSLSIALSPNNQTTRDNVTAQIEDLFVRRGFPNGTITKNQFGEAISTSASVIDYSLIQILQDNIQVTQVQNTPFQISVLGTISFSEI